jgi:hypothetical protein
MTQRYKLRIPLKEVPLENSELQYSCFVWKVPNRQINGGLIAFSGLYRLGSMGTPDAKLIQWRISEFYDAGYALRGLVVDFRDLDYRWGDDLAIPYPVHPQPFPIRVVVPPESKDQERYAAFKGMIGENKLRTDIHLAFEEIITEL